MHILHILPGPAQGQTANVAAQIIESLQKAGFRQRLISDGDGALAPDLAPNGVGVASEVLGSSWTILRRRRLRKLIEQMRPDCIQCWSGAAVAILPPTQIPVIGWFGEESDLEAFSVCSSIVVPTAALAVQLAERGAGAIIEIIPYCAADTAAAPLDRAMLATPRDAKILLCFDRLHPDSHLDAAIDALPDLKGFYLWLAGEGTHKHLLEAAAEQRGVMDRVRFVGPRLGRAALLKTADACLLMGRDSLGNSIVPESWASGLPLIMGVKAQASVPVEPGVTVVSIASIGSSALATTIDKLFSDDVLASRIVANGYAAYVKNFAREAVIRQWIRLYAHHRSL